MTSGTLVCVHAHPDDEALFGAGASAHYAALGYRVVLVTCTDGVLGIDAQGRAGDDAGHDDEGTRATRAGELLRSASIIGFERVVNLGFGDSGMRGWPQNTRPTAFMNADVDRVGATLGALLDEVDASVVVTYDEQGFYGHPDHVMTHRVTRRALELASSPRRLYYPVAPRGVLSRFVAGAVEQGVVLPAWLSDAGAGTPDDLVSTTLDVAACSSLKQAAIAAHASQSDNADLVTMDPALFALLFGTEYYQRGWSRRSVDGDATDLFGGL